ncbi:MAG TPA: hypothetical protein VMV46_15140 [Thermoanaerobaculia bacterium]|nr:hypothetical protein [Thermoanaerobaculia bacterium]
MTVPPPVTRPSLPAWRRRAAGLLGLLLLTVGGATLVRESAQALRGRERSPLAHPSMWLLGGPQTTPLEELAAAVDRLVPRGATVVVDTGYQEPERHYVEMWVAWLLPRHRVLPGRLPPPPGRPAYRLQVPPRAPEPGGDELLRSEAGALLRLGMP